MMMMVMMIMTIIMMDHFDHDNHYDDHYDDLVLSNNLFGGIHASMPSVHQSGVADAQTCNKCARHGKKY